MNARRRTKGDETWNRLLNWTDSQKASERLAGHILAQDGFESIDPSHPLGGPDGLKDLTCTRDGISYVVSVYFPYGKQSFTTIRSKFDHDIEGTIRNNANGFVFVLNQRLTVSEREKLRRRAPVDRVEIYHLDRIALILDRPECYGIRQEYLDIQMTKEELHAFAKIQTNAVAVEWQKVRGELGELKIVVDTIGAESERFRREFVNRMERIERLVQEALSQSKNKRLLKGVRRLNHDRTDGGD